MSKREGYDHLIKILLIGDSGVGKSCLLLRFADDQFTSSFITTIGIDFKVKMANIDGKKCKLQIWDTAGQERFRTITNSYFRSAQGILLVYDVTQPLSIANVKHWMESIDQHADEGVARVLIGNKCDDEANRKIPTARGEELAAEYGMRFFETSAKMGINVEKAFMEIATDVKRSMPGGSVGKGTVDVTGSGGTTKSACCSSG